MAACLPSDILQCVLQTWLHVDVRLLSMMDVAVCNHSMRPDLLHVIAQIACPSRDQISSLLDYLRWIAFRKVKVAELRMDISDMEKVGKLGFISLPTIREISFPFGNDGKFEIHVGSFALFLSKFPCLTVFHGWDGLTDDHVETLRSFKYDLEELGIQICSNLSAETVVGLISSVAHSLVKLECPALLDDATMVALSRLSFPALNEMDINCWDILDSESIVMLCAAVAGTLGTLRLQFFKPHGIFDDNRRNLVLTHKLAESLTVMCKRLTSFLFYCGKGEALLSLRAVFTHAPQIRELNVDDCGLRFSEHHGGWLVFISTPDREIIREVIMGIRGHVRHFVVGWMCVVMNDELLRMLAARLGAHITKLRMKLLADVDDGTMVNVLPLFPNLEHCHFAMDLMGNISDASLALLPVHCPKITELGIFANISDVGMCAILDGYRGNKMTSLKLGSCKLLTDITLNKIAANFPGLMCLELSETAVNKETVANLIATKKLRVKMLGCSDGKWVADQLKSLGFEGTSRF